MVVFKVFVINWLLVILVIERQFHIIYIDVAVALLVAADKLVGSVGRLLGCGSLVKALEVDHDGGATYAHDVAIAAALDGADEFATGERELAHAGLDHGVIDLARGKHLLGCSSAGDVAHYAAGQSLTGGSVGVLDDGIGHLAATMLAPAAIWPTMPPTMQVPLMTG